MSVACGDCGKKQNKTRDDTNNVGGTIANKNVDTSGKNRVMQRHVVRNTNVELLVGSGVTVARVGGLAQLPGDVGVVEKRDNDLIHL